MKNCFRRFIVYILCLPEKDKKTTFCARCVYSLALFSSKERLKRKLPNQEILLDFFISDLEGIFCQISRLGPTIFVLAGSLLPLVL